jgi:hypothetical protein
LNVLQTDLRRCSPPGKMNLPVVFMALWSSCNMNGAFLHPWLGRLAPFYSLPPDNIALTNFFYISFSELACHNLYKNRIKGKAPQKAKNRRKRSIKGGKK